MKKNISINIGGIIFHIEEEGFDHLKKYLDTISRYFSSFEDSKEIIDDIENRIAEILLSKLSDGNQVIVMEDINELIGTMGTVADFEASIETEPEEKKTQKGQSQKEQKEKEQKEKEEEPSSDFKADSGSKRLYRDVTHKVLGGVASGIAHYFNIDPIWIRLLIVALLFNLLFWGLSGATIIAYIILWIVLPPNATLEEDKNVKKLYRNPENRVIGGVSSGIAAYFGIDVTVVRLLFVVSIFLGGAGIFFYLCMWIITPEALTITQKMQMQGEPVTLSNIESNVKKSLKVDEGEENIFVKILLFPFRVISIVINGLAQVLGPLFHFLVEAFRIVFGVFVTLFGFTLMITTVIIFFVLIGVGFTWADYFYVEDYIGFLLTDSFNWMAATSVFLVCFVPSLSFTLLGLVIIMKRRVGNAYVGWSLFGLWILGLIGTASFVPNVFKEFRSENTHKEEIIFSKPDNTPTLRLNDVNDLNSYHGVNLKLRGHSDSTFKVVIRKDSRGSSRLDARENAETIAYKVTQRGNDFIFDSDIDFSNSKFRFQEIDAIFYIPFGETFRMERELDEILTNTLNLNGYHSYQMEGNDWVFDREGINCITCEDESRNNRRRSSGNESSSVDKSRLFRNWDDISGEAEVYDFENFNSVVISSLFNVKIVKGDNYYVAIKGDDIDEVYLNQRGGELNVKYRNDWDWWSGKGWEDRNMYIYITMPNLESIELVGGCKGEITGFDDRRMDINLLGASELNADIDPRYLEINLTGASRLSLNGKAKQMDAKVVGASRLDAYDFRPEDVTLKVLGASKVYVYASNEMDIDAAGVSTVKYRGTSNVRTESNGMSTIKRD